MYSVCRVLANVRHARVDKLTTYIYIEEHYFEMAQVDATTALKIYKSFCKQTEKVVTYLGVAKKMQNILNVPIPNLKHVSMIGYLLQPGETPINHVLCRPLYLLLDHWKNTSRIPTSSRIESNTDVIEKSQKECLSSVS